MKPVFLLLFVVNLTMSNCTNDPVVKPGKTDAPGATKGFEYSLETAHPNAKVLMTEDFFWSSIEETGPFGNDDGWDAAQGFREWRLTNKSRSPLTYLKELINRWEYPFFDWYETDTAAIKKFMLAAPEPDEAAIQQQMQQFKEAIKNSPDTSMRNMDDTRIRQGIISSAREMNGVFLLGQDNAIIATGFAQFALEGKIDKDLKALTLTAIKRQLLPLLIDRYDDNYRDRRKQQLTKMLEVINKAGS